MEKEGFMIGDLVEVEGEDGVWEISYIGNNEAVVFSIDDPDEEMNVPLDVLEHYE